MRTLSVLDSYTYGFAPQEAGQPFDIAEQTAELAERSRLNSPQANTHLAKPTAMHVIQSD